MLWAVRVIMTCCSGAAGARRRAGRRGGAVRAIIIAPLYAEDPYRAVPVPLPHPDLVSARRVPLLGPLLPPPPPPGEAGLDEGLLRFSPPPFWLM